MLEFIGEAPKTCQLCEEKIAIAFYDAKLKRNGPWAYVCPECHIDACYGVGLGRGQRYDKIDGKWVKTKG